VLGVTAQAIDPLLAFIEDVIDGAGNMGLQIEIPLEEPPGASGEAGGTAMAAARNAPYELVSYKFRFGKKEEEDKEEDEEEGEDEIPALFVRLPRNCKVAPRPTHAWP